MFTNKYAQEVVYLGFDYADRLVVGETITEAQFSIKPTIGTTADSASMLVGSAVITSGIVTIKVKDGIKGCTYELTALVTTSGSRVLLAKDTFQVV